MKKAKRKRVAVKKAAPPVTVKKVALQPTEILHVEVPKHVAPVVAVHQDRGIVQIVPVPKKKLAWWRWRSVFGE